MTVLWQWLTNSLWRYSVVQPSTFSVAYHWFNLGEGLAWCLIALLVLRRFMKTRRSSLEVVYAIAFVTFGVSDFVEAYALTVWLILAKGVNLLAILSLRRFILRHYYPEARAF